MLFYAINLYILYYLLQAFDWTSRLGSPAWRWIPSWYGSGWAAGSWTSAPPASPEENSWNTPTKAPKWCAKSASKGCFSKCPKKNCLIHATSIQQVTIGPPPPPQLVARSPATEGRTAQVPPAESPPWASAGTPKASGPSLDRETTRCCCFVVGQFGKINRNDLTVMGNKHDTLGSLWVVTQYQRRTRSPSSTHISQCILQVLKSWFVAWNPNIQQSPRKVALQNEPFALAHERTKTRQASWFATSSVRPRQHIATGSWEIQPDPQKAIRAKRQRNWEVWFTNPNLSHLVTPIFFCLNMFISFGTRFQHVQISWPKKSQLGKSGSSRSLKGLRDQSELCSALSNLGPTNFEAKWSKKLIEIWYSSIWYPHDHQLEKGRFQTVSCHPQTASVPSSFAPSLSAHRRCLVGPDPPSLAAAEIPWSTAGANPEDGPCQPWKEWPSCFLDPAYRNIWRYMEICH